MKNLRSRLLASAAALAMLAPAAAQQALPPNVQLQGHYIAGAPTPPVGTGCTIAAGSSDTDGSCTASAASGSIAFGQAFGTAPNCSLVDSTATPIAVYTTTTTQITLTTITSTHVYYWHCAAKIGG